jgi:hypothetical protein
MFCACKEAIDDTRLIEPICIYSINTLTVNQYHVYSRRTINASTTRNFVSAAMVFVI